MSEDELHRLMVHSLEGDRGAYRRMLTALAARLQVYFSKRVFHDSAAAADLTQETLIAIHDKRATFDPAQPLTPWVYAIARYKLVDHLRRRPNVYAEPESVLANWPAPGPGAEAEAVGADVERLLATLPEQQAQAIRMTKLWGLSTGEAALKLGISAANVKVSVHRGLKTLGATMPGQRDR